MTTNDPHADREAQKYANPIPSREYILEVLESSTGPLRHMDLVQQLALEDDNAIEALRRRLIAMERDGQLISNRRGAYGRLDKMDLVKGRVLAHRDGYGFVSPSGGGDDIYLSHRQMRKVFDGDEVLLRLGAMNSRGQKEGSIVEVLTRNTQQVVGQFVSEHGNQYVVPDNPKVHHDIFIGKGETLEAVHGQIVVVEITKQPNRNQRANGKIIEILGNHLAPGMEIDVAIRSYDIPHQWPSAVERQAESISAEVNEKDKKHRIDLRKLPFVTIDGEDARDFDDAVFCEKKRTGGWRLFVAIADVSHYVQINTAIDTEAVKRGNSVYFPNYVVPMLPEKLSNGLCSLNPKVDRLCMVCEMTISAAGRVSGYTFYESVIHSHARLTYTQVGEMVEQRQRKRSAIRTEYSEIIEHIDELHDLYHCLRAERTQRGAIDFETTETRMLFDSSRKIEKIIPVVRNDAHKMIEECMLAANVCAARFLETHEIACLYRVHESPKSEKMEALQAFLSEMGLSMPGTENVLPEHFQAIMKKIEGKPNAHLIQSVLLRSMNQAVYQATNAGHFGLSYPAYTHFTSPIRRYPDLLVHRAIRSIVRSSRDSRKVKRASGAKDIPLKDIYPYSVADVDGFGDQFSKTERRADEATRDVASWLKCEYLLDRVGETFSGVISAVTGFGLFVELNDLFVEGLVHVTALPHDYYRFQANQHRLVGERTRKVFRLGDAVSVRVVRVSLDERKIDFELAEQKSRRKTKSSSVKGDKPDAEKEVLAPSRQPRKRQLSAADSNENSSSGAADIKKSKKKPRSRTLKKSETETKSSTKKAKKKKPKASKDAQSQAAADTSAKSKKPKKKKASKKNTSKTSV